MMMIKIIMIMIMMIITIIIIIHEVERTDDFTSIYPTI